MARCQPTQAPIGSVDRRSRSSKRRSERNASRWCASKWRSATSPTRACSRRCARYRGISSSRRRRGTKRYADRPLPIGNGQTISQPYIVAFMTRAAAVQPKDRLPRNRNWQRLPGRGARRALREDLLDRVPARGRRASAPSNLRAAGYGPTGSTLRVGDGYQGWPEAAPFDVILVTAAPDHVPRPLLDSWRMGGRMVIPVGAQRRSGARTLDSDPPGSGRRGFPARAVDGRALRSVLGRSSPAQD